MHKGVSVYTGVNKGVSSVKGYIEYCLKVGFKNNSPASKAQTI